MKAASPSISPPPSAKRIRRSRWLIIGGVLGVTLLLLIVILIRLFPAWRQDRLLRRARIAIERKDYTNAALSARRALQVNNRSAPALALLAEIAEQRNPVESLYWRRRMVDLQPANLEARFALAEQALSLKKPSLAKDALAGVAERARQSARYHHISGRLALALENKPAAEADFARAAQMEPANSDYQIDLASLQIESKDEAIRGKARQTLDEFSRHPATLARTVPPLIADALGRRDYERAVYLANASRLRDGAQYRDSLYYLQLLHELKHPGYAAFLSELQEKAANSPEQVYELVSWMTANHSALVAIYWCKQLPSEVVNTMPVPMALARAYAILGDWAGLKPLVESQEEPDQSAAGAPPDSPVSTPPRDWKAYEFMRLALLSHALREEGNSGEWRILWNAAVKAANARPAALAILARATLDWKWEQESTELLWLVARGPSDQMWALNVLYSRYISARATLNALQVLTRMHEVAPDNADIRNNLANISLLLETNLDQATGIAESLHREAPNNPAYTSTLAFARYMQGRTDEALDLMRQLGEDQLHQPEFAAYFGVMLEGAGKRDQAKEFLRLGRAASLLPEEREMVERAVADAAR